LVQISVNVSLNYQSDVKDYGIQFGYEIRFDADGVKFLDFLSFKDKLDSAHTLADVKIENVPYRVEYTPLCPEELTNPHLPESYKAIIPDTNSYILESVPDFAPEAMEDLVRRLRRPVYDEKH